MMGRLSDNAHLLRYPHPSSLRSTCMYASFLGISEALHMDILSQPLLTRLSDSPWETCPKRGLRIPRAYTCGISDKGPRV